MRNARESEKEESGGIEKERETRESHWDREREEGERERERETCRLPFEKAEQRSAIRAAS